MKTLLLVFGVVAAVAVTLFVVDAVIGGIEDGPSADAYR